MALALLPARPRRPEDEQSETVALSFRSLSRRAVVRSPRGASESDARTSAQPLRPALPWRPLVIRAGRSLAACQTSSVPRHLVVRAAQIVSVIAIGVVAISALPGLDEVRGRLEGAEPAWIAALVVAELGPAPATCSCSARTSARRCRGGLSYDIAMAELAANSLLPAGGAGGLALGVWALRQAGMPTAQIARRTIAFFVVTSAANFFALIVVGSASSPASSRAAARRR